MAGEVLYRKIYQDLINGIMDGTYPTGSRLPSEMELAEQYGVSRITSKKALEMLADRGLVFRQPGKGTFVTGERPSPEPEEAAEEQPAPEPEKQIVIGVVFDSIGPSFGTEILNGIEYECTRRNMLMMLRFTYGSIEAEKKALRDMREAGVSGVILMGAQGKSYDDEVLKLYLDRFPLVLVDRAMKGIPIPVVTTDNYKAAFELTERLIQAGHMKIGYLSHSHIDTSTIDARFQGFCAALHAAGIPVDGAYFKRDMDAYLPRDDDDAISIPTYMRELSDFIDGHPDITAFFAVEFSIAKLTYMVLEEKGLEKEKALVYFDGFTGGPAPLSRRCLHVLQDQYQMGVAAMRSLAHIIRGESAPECEHVPYSFVEIEE